MQLRDTLDQAAIAALRRMAATHGVAHDDASTRAELISRLCERFDDPAYVDGLLSGLSEAERGALSAAVATGGESRGFILERDFPGAVASLLEQGLLFRTFTAAGMHRGEVFTVPDEVRRVLPPPAPEAAAPPGSPAPAERRATDPTFSLFALASALRRSSSNLEAEVRGWSEEPGGWDWQLRWTFLRHLAQASGLLTSAADGTYAHTSALLRLLADPPALADRLWRAYERDRSWPELAHARFDRSHVTIELDHVTDHVLVRQALLDRLDRLPEGTWTDVESISDWLRRTAPNILREHLDPRARIALEVVDWDQLEQHLLRFVLLGPLYWLGRVSASPDGHLIARRSEARGTTHDTEPCSWDGDAVLASPRANLGALLQAERYLVLEVRGRPSRYRLAQQHVAAALVRGGSIDECRRLLERLTQAPLPAAVDARLQVWREQFGALTLRPAVLLEARTEADLQSVIDDAAVRPFVRRRIGPTAIEIPAADSLALAEALHQLGRLPRVDAALRLGAGPRSAYAGLIDEQVLEFLFVSLLAFRQTRPDRLADIEGALGVLDRLEALFPPERLATLETAARTLSGDLHTPAPASARPRRTPSPRRKKPTRRP